MARVVILGSSNSIPTPENENTHLLVVGARQSVLIDCVSNPVVRLQQAGVEPVDLTDLVLTHFHPDHVSGAPLLLMAMWLMGRRHPLQVHGLAYTLDRFEQMMDLYGWRDWPDFFPVVFHRLPAAELSPLLDGPDFRVVASPVRHMIPALGLRFEFHPSGKALAYSCDTAPCDEVMRLARDAEVLIHEASGPFVGHTSAAQAGEVAARARARHLILIHYPTGRFAAGDPLAEARATFAGQISLARDWMTLEF